MYKQFCKNLKYFVSIIRNDALEKNFRLKNAEALLPLTDIEKYMEYRNSQSEEYERISNLIFDLSYYSKEYPSLKRLVWELWAYGFDMEQAKGPETRNYDIDEVVKLTDLMLSTHYFI